MQEMMYKNKNDIFMQKKKDWEIVKKDQVITLVGCFGKVESSVWIYGLNPKTKKRKKVFWFVFFGNGFASALGERVSKKSPGTV